MPCDKQGIFFDVQQMLVVLGYFYDALCATSPRYRFSMKKGMIKPEPYTKEPYPTTHAELKEREEREAKAKEERLKAEFTAFVERMRKKSTNT